MDEQKLNQETKNPLNQKKRTTKAKKSAAQGGAARRSYPCVTLLKALLVAQKIKELNGGNPWTPDGIATALDVGAKSPKFYYITAASRDFGLTTGTRDTPSIALTDLGRAIVYAPDRQAEHAKKVEAFLSVDLFKRVLDYYKGSSLPEMKYLGNTLENEFKLQPKLHEEFSRLFRENCQDLGITAGPSGVSAGRPEDNGRMPATLIVGVPKGGDVKDKPKAFIIMPFVEKTESRAAGFFKEVLRSLAHLRLLVITKAQPTEMALQPII